MPTLKVPGADLHYETVGDGPMLLAIHGGDGSGEIWRGFSEALKDRFTIVLYDRTCMLAIFGRMLDELLSEQFC